MRTLPAGIQAAIDDGGTLSFCRAFELTRKDGTVQRFADSQSAFAVGVNTFDPMTGIYVGPLQIAASGGSGSITIDVAADGSTIDAGDLISGAYDDAALVFYVADHVTPANGLVTIWRGWISEISLDDRGGGQLVARGLLSKSRFLITEHYTPVCRAYFGDSRCGVDLGPLTFDAEVVSLSGFNLELSITGTPPAYGFALGVVVGVTGQNAGRAVEIKSWNAGTSTAFLFLQPELAFAPGDLVQIVPGCDYTTGANGCGRYGNILNFRGEPFAPGQDATAIDYTAWGT